MVALTSSREAAGVVSPAIPRWRAQVTELAPAGWLFVRVALGIEWIRGGWEKIGDPGWTAAPVGKAVEGFLNGAIAKSTVGRYPEVPHWFHNLAQDVFLPNAELFTYLVAFGELLVGLALLLGALTRVAAFFGVTMNATFLWAGTSSANPQMMLLGLAIVLAGRRAGAYGVDRWLMPRGAKLLGARASNAVGIVVLAGLVAAVAWLVWISVTPLIWLIAAAFAVGAAVLRLAARR